MTVQAGPRLRAYVTAGIVGLVVALAVGDPAPALIGAALLALAMLGLTGPATPRIELTVLDLPSSGVEGEPFGFTIRIEVGEPIGRSFVDLALNGLDLLEVAGARKAGPSIIILGAIEETAEIRLTVKPTTWGRSSIGPPLLYTDSALGMVDLVQTGDHRRQIVILPEEIALRTLLSPIEPNLHVGDLVSRRRGAGAEFADLRPFNPGDDPRAVNWRVSSRLQSLWVNERHPERNGDVVLLVDAQVERGTELHRLVDRSIRLAAALIQAYSRRHHRLGLVTLDGVCRWVYPGMGEMWRRRLLEQLMAVVPGRVTWEIAERSVVRAVRRPSFVIALTPLMDPNMAGLIHTLRRSGVDISVITLDIESVLPEPPDSARALGRRIWALERQRLEDRLAGEGVPIVEWRSTDAPDVPLAQLDLWRTTWRRLG